MKITILFFATLRSLTGRKTLEMSLPHGSLVADLKDLLVQQYPQLAPALLDSVLVSVNREYADDTQIIPNNAEVALFPPVSGG